jgi:cytochrome c oxidase cbb3-type subunit 2
MTRTEFVAVRLWFVSAIVACLTVLGYAALAAQPPATSASVSSASAPGQDVYAKHCAECHGDTGHGDGGAAHLLVPRPRDFTAGKYKIRTTETGSAPTDDDLIRAVSKGLYGSAMPGWETLLSDAQIGDVVTYLKTFSPRFKTDPARAITVSARVDATPSSIERGAAVYTKLQCGKCHGSDGRGTDAVARDFVDDWSQPLHAANLTEPWTFRGGAAARDIFMRFRAGMSGTPMPSFAGSASDVDMWDLANYVVSLARKPVWEMSAREVTDFYAQQDREAKANPVARGRYLVDTMGCALCHSPIDEHKRLIPGFYMAGGMRIHIEPYGDYPTGNLTSDKATGLGTWTDDEIKRVVTKGILKDGSRLLPYPMDWPSYASTSASDLDAIVAYLRTVPPIVNKVPAPSRTILPVHLWGKFKMLMLGGDPPMTFYAGNAGQRGTP